MTTITNHITPAQLADEAKAALVALEVQAGTHLSCILSALLGRTVSVEEADSVRHQIGSHGEADLRGRFAGAQWGLRNPSMVP